MDGKADKNNEKKVVKRVKKRPSPVTLEMAGISAQDVRRIVARLKEDDKSL